MNNARIFFVAIGYSAIIFNGSWIRKLIYSTKRESVEKYLAERNKEGKILIFKTEIKTGKKKNLEKIKKSYSCDSSLSLDINN